MLEDMHNKQMHSSFCKRVKNTPLQWKKCLFPDGKHDVQFNIATTFIWYLFLSLNEWISLHSREGNHGKQHSQWSGTGVVAACSVSLISFNIWNYFKGRNDFQQGLVTPGTIRSWTEPWELSGFLARGPVSLSPLHLQAPFKNPS